MRLYPVIQGLITLVALALLMWLLLPRRGEPRRTPVQLFIVALYRWARWWSCLAAAVDRGYLTFRMEMRTISIAPVNEDI